MPEENILRLYIIFCCSQTILNYKILLCCSHNFMAKIIMESKMDSSNNSYHRLFPSFPPPLLGSVTQDNTYTTISEQKLSRLISISNEQKEIEDARRALLLRRASEVSGTIQHRHLSITEETRRNHQISLSRQPPDFFL